MIQEIFERLGIQHDPRLASPGESGCVLSENPATGRPLAAVRVQDATACDQTVAAAVAAFSRWRAVPAPVRGQVVRAIGDEFRRLKPELGALVSLEVGKIRSEGLGEIQEIVDVADFAVGLSRQLPGLTLPSERPGHRMLEQWLPLGPVACITAFNFPAAVWGWNAMLAAVCGDPTVWKPSLLAPLTAVACNAIATRVADAMGHPGIFQLLLAADDAVSERLAADRRVPLVSATGSCRMGRRVGSVVAQRLGRSLLELGGNNACIVHHDADLELALRSTVFGAVGTAGQRCTTTRRLYVHAGVAEGFIARMAAAYRQVQTRLGDPLADGTLVGPLVSGRAVEGFLAAVADAKAQGAQVLAGGEVARLPGALGGGHFVQPTLIRAPANNHLPIAAEETFAPILYVFTYTDLDQAVAMQNAVDQGLSSAIFTDSIRAGERFLAPDGSGSDCGIANINCGTSGAEIGGAFGGEKDTGGGRESGSDSWKAYMRRQTCTINFSGKFELAQGIRFE